jgi:hypothetical protein
LKLLIALSSVPRRQHRGKHQTANETNVLPKRIEIMETLDTGLGPP